MSPGNGARVQQLPAITWKGVRGAAAYEYQVSTNARFHSIILGSGPGRGTAHTYNTAAALEKDVADGTYYWRVRALTAKDRTGPWSRVRRIVKKWTTRPSLTGGNGVTVNWPSEPLVLRWSSVPYAAKYIVTVATDPGLSNIVLGTKTKPAETQAVNFALPNSLDPRGGAPYYWAITPLDAQGHPGARSASGFFTWQWPTQMSTVSVTDLNPEAGAFDDPLFSWTPVAGAARYEIEVNADEHFAAGSKWCCTGTTTGTSLAPLKVLANNRYYWRVRAIDARGNAGVWNYGRSQPGPPSPQPPGEPFEKAFDPSTPTIRNLTVRDASGNVLGGAPSVDTPIVTWDPVPGASRYEVQIGQYSSAGCDWTLAGQGLQNEPTNAFRAFTSTPAWTPIGHTVLRVGPSAWPHPQKALENLPAQIKFTATTSAGSNVLTSPHFPEGRPAVGDIVTGPGMPAGTEVDRIEGTTVVLTNAATQTEKNAELTATPRYCVRVLARSDDDAQKGQVISAWSQINGDNHAAFTYLSPPPGKPEGFVTPASAYLLPASGSSLTLTPLLTWKRVGEAKSYWVVIARDARFTEVADVGFTHVPAYAPRVYNEAPLADETTSYYWAVIPAKEDDGSGIFSTPCYQTPSNPCEADNDNPQVFNKSSNPPTPLAPANGEQISTQPTFRWAPAPADNARSYRLEVSLDPSFGTLIDDVTTDDTAYTSSSTYPTSTPLYWRVRANDWIGQGLNWSPTQTFVRLLPTPQPDPFGPSAAIATTPLTWNALQGAISYDLHINQADGKSKDYTFESPAASAVEYYGTGFGHFTVRAEFPTAAIGGKVAGPYSATMQLPVLTLPPPAGARGVRRGSRLLITWRPEKDAIHYRVEVSTSNGFGKRIETRTLDGTSWAPSIDTHKKQFRRALYWRVAAVDKRGGLGSYAAGAFRRR